LQKRAYLAKYLMPVEVPADFQGEPLIIDLLSRLKDMQADFKEVHKVYDQVRSNGARPAELKAEIAQLENERIQLQNKISRMKKDTHGDEQYFHEMLKVYELVLFRFLVFFIFLTRTHP
jgi:intraflagellar transport protein 81